MERDVLSRELEIFPAEHESLSDSESLEAALDHFWPQVWPTPVTGPAISSTAPVKLDEDLSPGYTAYVEIDLKIPPNPCYKGYFKEDKIAKTSTFVCTGSIKGSVQKKTALFAPSHLKVSSPIDIIVYLHGHLGGHPGIKKISHSPCIKEYFNYKGAPYFNLRELMESGNRNAVMIAPTLGPRSQYGSFAKNFDSYFDKAIAGVKEYLIKRKKSDGNFTLGKIIIAAHSGGGSPMLQALSSKNKHAESISEVWGFDSWYNGNDPWEKYAKKKPSSKIYGVHYSSAYLPNKPALKIKRNQVKNFYTVRVSADAPSLDHFTLLPYYFKERLADQGFSSAVIKEKEIDTIDHETIFAKDWNFPSNVDMIDQRFNFYESPEFESMDSEVADPSKSSSPFHHSKFAYDKSDSAFFEFKTKVYQAHVRWAASGGKPFVADQPATDLRSWKNKEDLTYSVKKGKKIYKGVTVHARMEDPLRQLLDQARVDAKNEGKDINVYISNGYRSATTQFNSWDANFKTYYERAIREAGFTRGNYSSSAVESLSVFIRAKLGAPGYSNHQHGRAVDFFLLEWSSSKGKKEAFEVSTKKANVDKWRKTWFFHWLESNAASFGFCPYDKEPWHWEYWKDIDPNLDRCKKKTVVSRKTKAPSKNSEIDFEDWEMETTTVIPATCSTKKLKKTKKGYSGYGGGKLDDKLRALRTAGKLSITDNEILLLQELARTESSGLVQAINSWDSAFMSMGFAQFTFIHKHHFPYKKIKQLADARDLQRIAKNSPEAYKFYFDKKDEPGKLQMMIELAPAAFKKYGIELSGTIKWRDKKKNLHEVSGLKGLQSLSELRSLDWAKRFYCAGLDEDIIISQAKLVLFVLDMSLYTMQAKIGSNYFISYYKSSPSLRGLIQEAYNNRPAYLITALKRSSQLLSPKGQVPASEFLSTLKKAIVEEYDSKENDKEKGLRLTGKY